MRPRVVGPSLQGGRKRTMRTELDTGRLRVCWREEHPVRGQVRHESQTLEGVVIVRTDMCPTLTIGLQAEASLGGTLIGDSERAMDRQLGQVGYGLCSLDPPLFW